MFPARQRGNPHRGPLTIRPLAPDQPPTGCCPVPVAWTGQPHPDSPTPIHHHALEHCLVRRVQHDLRHVRVRRPPHAYAVLDRHLLRQSKSELVRQSPSRLVHKSTSPQVHKSTSPQVHKSTSPQVHKSTCPLVHLSACPLVEKSTCREVHLSATGTVALFYWAHASSISAVLVHSDRMSSRASASSLSTVIPYFSFTSTMR